MVADVSPPSLVLPQASLWVKEESDTLINIHIKFLIQNNIKNVCNYITTKITNSLQLLKFFRPLQRTKPKSFP